MGRGANDQPEKQAYQNALLLMVAGFVFVMFSIKLAGIDLLIDAVGWILVFNGVRPIEKPGGGIGLCACVCLALTGVSAVQMLFPLMWADLARAALEVVFFLLLSKVMGRFWVAEGLAGTPVLLKLALFVSVAAALVPALWYAIVGRPYLWAALSGFALVAHAALLLAFIWVINLVQKAKDS